MHSLTLRESTFHPTSLNATHNDEFTFNVSTNVLPSSSYLIHRFCLVYFSWKAANYSQFWGMSLDEGLRYRLGTQRPSRAIMSMNEIQVSGVDTLYTTLYYSRAQIVSHGMGSPWSMRSERITFNLQFNAGICNGFYENITFFYTTNDIFAFVITYTVFHWSGFNNSSLGLLSGSSLLKWG